MDVTKKILILRGS